MSENKYKAVKYIRLSCADDRDGESNSVENQRRLLDHFIASQPDIEAVSEKVDDGYSGLVFDRPAFKAMMEDIQNGRINCVIVKDLSRFGREYIATGRYLRRTLPALGVRFIAVNDDVDTLSERAGDNLLLSVKNIVNDAYCRDISAKTRSALSVKRGRGDYVGATPVYGYKKSGECRNRLDIDEYPASVVRDIYRMKIEGMSAAKIAETLNGMGVLSPVMYKKDRGLPFPAGGFADRAGAKWSPIAIIRILRDETYTGTLVQNRRGTISCKISEIAAKPVDEWQRTENAHEAIISMTDFALVQRLMKLDTRTAPSGRAVYLFSGLLVCGCCGARMSRKTNRYKGQEYFYYHCSTGKKNGCDGGVMLKESDLTNCVLEILKAYISNIASLEGALSLAAQAKAAGNLAKKYERQITENERQLQKVGKDRARLYEHPR